MNQAIHLHAPLQASNHFNQPSINLHPPHPAFNQPPPTTPSLQSTPTHHTQPSINFHPPQPASTYLHPNAPYPCTRQYILCHLVYTKRPKLHPIELIKPTCTVTRNSLYAARNKVYHLTWLLE